MMPTLIQNIACHFLMGFLIESHLIMHVAGSQQNFPQIRNILGMHLFIQPLDIFAGVLQIFLHNVTVNDHISYKELLFRSHRHIFGNDGTFVGFWKETHTAIGFQYDCLQIRQIEIAVDPALQQHFG